MLPSVSCSGPYSPWARPRSHGYRYCSASGVVHRVDRPSITRLRILLQSLGDHRLYRERHRLEARPVPGLHEVPGSAGPRASCARPVRDRSAHALPSARSLDRVPRLLPTRIALLRGEALLCIIQESHRLRISSPRDRRRRIKMAETRFAAPSGGIVQPPSTRKSRWGQDAMHDHGVWRSTHMEA